MQKENVEKANSTKHDRATKNSLNEVEVVF